MGGKGGEREGNGFAGPTSDCFLRTCSVDKEFELPTLIHFAAKFGFKELCARLIDLPDASHSGKFSNGNGQQPNEIARIYGHHELRRFLDNFLEMVGPIGDLCTSSFSIIISRALQSL